MQVREYQTDLKRDIYQAWREFLNVIAVLPTGGGKTWTFSEIVKEFNGAAAAVAHRQELVSQISLSFAKHGIRHRIIGPDNVVRLINRLHVEELGKSYYHPNAPTAVVGVDTLIARAGKLKRWAESIGLWVTDEAHHLLKDNKWGKAAAMFPNAKGLGVTATPVRADGKGLGRHADGLFDTMVEGPSMRDLIEQGYLTDYRIFAPPSDLDMSKVLTGANGDWTQPGTKAAVRGSTVIGDVVKHYLRIAPGKLGITFATDVETATDIAAQFNASGVPAEVVSAKTPDADRVRILRRFKNRELLQLVNVDLFGEGFDLPAIEVVSMARPTQSFSLFVQQCGRALRTMSGKIEAIIIDHVGNIERHARVIEENGKLIISLCSEEWTLDRREKRKKNAPFDAIPVKACPTCTAVYERIYSACPYCGFKPLAMARSGPEMVDGDLCELDPSVLAAMRGEAIDLNMTPLEYLQRSGADRLPHIPRQAAAKRHAQKQEAQKALREVIAWWAGYQRAAGRPDSESYRRFYFKFGTDVLSAQALAARDATELQNKITLDLG